MARESGVPGGFIQGRELFQRKVDIVDGQPVVTGFTAKDQEFYAFTDGEELVVKPSGDGRVEEVLVRIFDEKGKSKEIPVQDWIKLYHSQDLN